MGHGHQSGSRTSEFILSAVDNRGAKDHKTGKAAPSSLCFKRTLAAEWRMGFRRGRVEAGRPVKRLLQFSKRRKVGWIKVVGCGLQDGGKAKRVPMSWMGA